MYTLIRKVHLYTAMSLLAFVMMYFVTGYVMVHERWFSDQEPKRSIRKEALRYDGEKTPEVYAISLQEQFGLRGKRLPPERLENGGWTFRYVRPGTSYEAVVSANGDSVQITRSEGHFRGVMVGLHRLHGYGGGGLYDVWAFLYDLASVAVILFACSGVYMWYKLTKGSLFGWILLGLSIGYAIVTILYLVYAP